MQHDYPFTFATSSEQWGDANQRGKYPVKLYNSSSVLIHQVDSGGDNSGLKPSGGVVVQTTAASSMSATIANPITFYGNNGLSINQDGQSGDLYNYYFASYSRGTDGRIIWPKSDPNWHNLYLDSYIPLRHKSIYDPCPYGYRVPSNGTYNEFINTGWLRGSCVGGVVIMDTWTSSAGGLRNISTFDRSGGWIHSQFSIVSSDNAAYLYDINSTPESYPNTSNAKSVGVSVRCIEDCDLLPDQTHSSAGY